MMKKIAVVAGIFLLGLCGITVVGFMFMSMANTPRVAVAPIIIETPPATRVPTRTVAPTQTPTVMPTVAPTVALTVAPTVAPTELPVSDPVAGGATDDELIYLVQIYGVLKDYQGSLERFSLLMGNASVNTDLLVNNTWRGKVVDELKLWKINYLKMQMLSPSVRLAGFHDELLTMSKHYNNAADMAAEGLDNMDADKLQQATVEISLGNAALDKAAVEMNALK
jgi:hypothetical protein